MVGQTVSHYRIVGPLGSGGMGVVYEAEDTRLGRKVALKLIPRESGHDAVALERFLREARIISSLNHPHICTLHDIGEHEGQPFMVMELLDGEPLKSRVSRGALPFEDVLDLGVQMAEALEAAHGQGVVHRDLKPANIFVTRRGHLKVLDFGVAKLGESSKDEHAETMAGTALTTAGSTIGTVAYMSPEQARGQEIDARSDLFSFGIVLYEMATGRVAFPGATSAVMFEGILTKSPPRPSEINAGVPAEFDRIVMKALEKDREMRYQGAAEVRADLKRLKRESETGSGLISSATGSQILQPPTIAGIESRPDVGSGAAVAGVGRGGRRKALLVGAPLMTAAAVAALFFWQSEKAPALSTRDTVVLADFVNRTGDTMFDDTLAEALAMQLRQSPFLNLVPEQQVQSTLRLMGRPSTESVTPELGRDLCQRVGGKAVLGGTIASLGTSYLITLSAQDCVTGDVLADAQVQADAKEKVIAAIGTVSSQFRERLGESLASVQRYDAPIEAATTPSLDALKAYTQGVIARRTRGDAESVAFFRRAIDLDPDFALAYARLGTVYANLGQPDDSRVMTQRSWDLRDKVSERERLYIEARYHTTVTQDRAKAIDTYKLLLASYPGDYSANTNLGILYRAENRYSEALTHLEESIRITPDNPLSYGNLADLYRQLGRLQEARRALETAVKLQDGTPFRAGLYNIGVLTGDAALRDAQVEAVRGRRDEWSMTAVRVNAALYAGQPAAASAFIDEFEMQSRSAPNREFFGEVFGGFAISFALLGDEKRARAEVARIEREGLMRPGTGDEMLVFAAILGDGALARKYAPAALRNAGESAPADLETNRLIVTGFTRAAERDWPGSIDAIERANAKANDPQLRLFVAMMRMRAGQFPEAAAILDALSKDIGTLGVSAIQPYTHVLHARALAGTGDTAGARRAYEQALAILKAAEPGVPLLQDARKELAALSS